MFSFQRRVMTSSPVFSHNETGESALYVLWLQQQKHHDWLLVAALIINCCIDNKPLVISSSIKADHFRFRDQSVCEERRGADLKSVAAQLISNPTGGSVSSEFFWLESIMNRSKVYLVVVVNLIYELMHWLFDVLIMCYGCQHGSQAVVSGVSPQRRVVSSSALLCRTHCSFMDQPEAWR